jgi:hypothetical protein
MTTEKLKGRQGKHGRSSLPVIHLCGGTYRISGRAGQEGCEMNAGFAASLKNLTNKVAIMLRNLATVKIFIMTFFIMTDWSL